MFSLEGKVALVIGGSRGIGRGMAAGLARAGATAVLSSRNQLDLDTAAEELSKETGSEVIGIGADVSCVPNIKSLVNQITDRYGHLDILINAAGVNVRKGCLDFKEEDWDLVQNIQLRSVFFTCQAVAKQMLEKQIRGRIINVASISSTIALKNMVSYCAAKGGLVQMTKAFALELAESGITANCMAPGYTKTEMTKALFADPKRVEEMMSRIPQKRFGLPEDYEGIAAYLASDEAAYITGQLITVDGGWIAS